MVVIGIRMMFVRMRGHRRTVMFVGAKRDLLAVRPCRGSSGKKYQETGNYDDQPSHLQCRYFASR
jgi:hypothetical protein